MIKALLNKTVKLSVVGLGYVGLPLAVMFSRKMEVIGYDENEQKIKGYQQGKDPTGEIGNDALVGTSILFTADATKLRHARFHIIAVPTPVGRNNIPDLDPLERASVVVGRNLTRGSIVVYESTVYPGVTEEICLPILEKESGLTCGVDFKIGYSPERINPGDKVNTVENIVKIVSGMDEESRELIAEVYRFVVKAGVHCTSSIRVAEAAKVIENSQRDINIAFMNELSIIFHKLGIDTKEVLEAAGTKWNFLNFSPGLVGGHCIGVDPYYLTYRAEELGYHPEVLLTGRRINDQMGKYVAENAVKLLIKAGYQIKDAKALILGVTFKENVSDARNSKVFDIMNELIEYGVQVTAVDPLADENAVKKQYGVSLTTLEKVEKADVVIVAVQHEAFYSLTLQRLKEYFNGTTPVLLDVKGMYDKDEAKENGYVYWRL